ncbi:hypothetical protein [Nocardia abscessus]|uniref:hypothetical protein n=1 Tax=Nocardia abscessus TaxID=120957 RepID=UPI002453C501|nr:hypothetical protein [Nocardia abscessus]
MSDTPNTPDPAAPVTAPVQTPENVDSLPEWARNKLTEANHEAAKYRVEKNNAVTAAKAEVAAEFETKLADEQAKYGILEQNYAKQAAQLLALEVAIDAKVPHDKTKDFAALLKGETEDELRSHAETLKGLFGKTDTKDRPVDPTQGTGNTMPLNGDPILNALKETLRMPHVR